MNEEDALLKAVIASAGDDTPRLVYADWLDEHEAPVQAEFIRTQCRLASCSPADPDYPDLLERAEEVALRFGLALRLTAPQLPPGFKHDGDFRRGFLHSATAEWRSGPAHYYESHVPPGDEQLDRVCAGLADLVANTTVRHLALYQMTPDALARVLTEPAARLLTGLSVSSAQYDDAGGDGLIRALARSPVVANLECLELSCPATVTGLAALNASPDRLRTLTLPALSGRADDVPVLARTGWFRELREVRVWNAELPIQELLFAALASLSRLGSLSARVAHQTALKALGGATGFPELTRLTVENWAATDRLASQLARGRFPRLAELTVPNLLDGAFATLLGAKWLPRLRALNVSGSSLTDKSAAALSKSAAASHLRVLKAASNRFTKAGLTALGDGARFPALTTLDLAAARTQVRPETVTRFAAELSSPHIRHLDLGRWPLEDTGARALASNPHLANVTRLFLSGGRIGDRGFTALARSRHLQSLLELRVWGNSLKKAAALLDPDALPRLVQLDLSGNPIKPADLEALRRARGWLV